MGGELSFVVIDFHAESRFLLVKTLRRKFPEAVIDEMDELAPAIERVATRPVAAVVTHRTFDCDGIELVRELRAVGRGVPIIMVSGINREEDALRAGATAFLSYDEWLRIGSVVEGELKAQANRTVAGAADAN